MGLFPFLRGIIWMRDEMAVVGFTLASQDMLGPDPQFFRMSLYLAMRPLMR